MVKPMRCWMQTVSAKLVLMLAILSTQACSANAKPITITIDPSIQYQTMTGWEATLDLAENPANPEWTPMHDEILDRAVEELGLNRVRLEIRSGAETRTDWIDKMLSVEIDYDTWKQHRYQVQNDNDDPNNIDWSGFNFNELDWHVEENLLPLKERVEARGERLWINICYVAFITGWNPHHDPDEYAEFVLATYLHLQEKYGLVPDSWEVILEPDLKQDMWSGKMIGEAIAAAGPKLIEAGFEPSFVVPSVTNMRNAVPYTKAIAKVPGAMQYVSEISYHRYRGANPQTVKSIAKLAEKHGKKTSMLEWWFGKGTHAVLHEDLKLGKNSSWQGRVLNGHFRVEGRKSNRPSLRLQREVRYNKLYFQNVRIGAVRIGASSTDERTMDPLAFLNPDGSMTLIVKSDAPGDLLIKGLSDGAYTVSYAIADESRELSDPIISDGGSATVRMPGEGVLSLTSYSPATPE